MKQNNHDILQHFTASIKLNIQNVNDLVCLLTNMSVKRILQNTTKIFKIQHNMEKYQKYLALVKIFGYNVFNCNVIHITLSYCIIELYLKYFNTNKYFIIKNFLLT